MTRCARLTTSGPGAGPLSPDGRGGHGRAVQARADGRWLLGRTHPGRVYFDLEGGVGTPSRWNTLRAFVCSNGGTEPPCTAERRRAGGVLPVCHDDADWYAGSSMFEHSPASLVLT